MAFFDFLGDTFQGIGNFGADTDKFMKREMPFDSGWGAPAALVAAIAAPEVIPMFAEAAPTAAGATEVGTTAGGAGGFMDGFGSLFGGSNGGSSFMPGEHDFLPSGNLGSFFSNSGSGGFGIGKGANYTDFVNTSGGSFGNLNSMPSPSGSEYGLNFGSPSSIASSNSSMGLSDLSPTGGSGGTDFLNQLMKSQQKTAQQNQSIFDNYQPMDVKRQATFLATPNAVNVQDKQTDLAALIKALRG